MTPGERFARAFAAKDASAVREVLDPQVDFMALTPRRFWEAAGTDEVLTILFGSWLEDHDEVTGVVSVEEGDAVGDTQQVGYRLALRTPDGPHVMEQQAYYRTEGDQVTYLRVVCSGFRPVS